MKLLGIFFCIWSQNFQWYLRLYEVTEDFFCIWSQNFQWYLRLYEFTEDFILYLITKLSMISTSVWSYWGFSFVFGRNVFQWYLRLYEVTGDFFLYLITKFSMISTSVWSYWGFYFVFDHKIFNDSYWDILFGSFNMTKCVIYNFDIFLIIRWNAIFPMTLVMGEKGPFWEKINYKPLVQKMWSTIFTLKTPWLNFQNKLWRQIIT
jgi:hypothetical protein